MKPERAETASSGADVPKPITTMPMTNGETPSAFATAAEPSTNRLAPQVTSQRPPATKTRARPSGMSMYMLSFSCCVRFRGRASTPPFFLM